MGILLEGRRGGGRKRGEQKKIYNSIKTKQKKVKKKKREEPVHCHNHNQKKLKSNSTNNSMFNYLGFTHDLLDSFTGLESLLRLCPLQHTQIVF